MLASKYISPSNWRVLLRPLLRHIYPVLLPFNMFKTALRRLLLSLHIIPIVPSRLSTTAFQAETLVGISIHYPPLRVATVSPSAG